MEIHFQTTDHVVAVEKVAEQHIATKYCKCNSLRVISHIIILGKSAITTDVIVYRGIIISPMVQVCTRYRALHL